MQGKKHGKFEHLVCIFNAQDFNAQDADVARNTAAALADNTPEAA